MVYTWYMYWYLLALLHGFSGPSRSKIRAAGGL